MWWNYVASSTTVIYVTQCYYPSCPEERLDDIGSLITSLVTRSHINSKCLQRLKQWSLNSAITFSICTCVRLRMPPQNHFFFHLLQFLLSSKQVEESLWQFFFPTILSILILPSCLLAILGWETFWNRSRNEQNGTSCCGSATGAVSRLQS